MRRTMMLNWLHDQHELNAMKFSEENNNHTNGKFNPKFEEKFSESTNQSQQSNVHQNEQNQFVKTNNGIPCETGSIPIRRLNNSLCFERTDRQTHRKLLGFIDVKIKNNLITEKHVKHGKILKLKYPKIIETEFGLFEISSYVKVNIFSNDLNFLIVDTIGNFDILLGLDGLKKIDAKIDSVSLQLIYQNKIEKKIDVCNKLDKKEGIEKSKIRVGVNFDTMKNAESFVNIKLKKAKEIEELKIEKAEKIKIEKGKFKKGKNEKSIQLSKSRKIQNENVLNGKIGRSKFDTDINFKKIIVTGNRYFSNVSEDFKYFEPG